MSQSKPTINLNMSQEQRYVGDNVSPAVLKWARESNHHSLKDAIEELDTESITEEVLAGWEDGSISTNDERFTSDVLRQLAKYYQIDFVVFFFAEIPDYPDPMVELRKVPEVSSKFLPYTTVRMIREVHSGQTLLEEINESGNPIVANPLGALAKNLKFPSQANKVEKFANQIRTNLSVTPDKQLGWVDDAQALEGWIAAIERKGIFIFRQPLNSEGLSGFCLYDKEFPAICINHENPESLQTFILFHELVHLLNGKSNLTLSKNELELNAKDNPREYFVDSIASSVLIPKDHLQAQISSASGNADRDVGAKGLDFYIQTAKQYKVSPLTLLYRAKLAELIGAEVFEGMKKSLTDIKPSTTEHQAEHRANEELSTDDAYVRDWGTAYLTNVFDRYHQGLITELETARIIERKLNEIPILEGLVANKANERERASEQSTE